MKATLDPPEFLTDAARAEWARVLTLPGIEIGESDVAVLALYCQSWARWADAERRLSEDGSEIVMRDDKGNVKAVLPCPWVGIGQKAQASMLKAARELGLGPGRRLDACGRPASKVGEPVPDAEVSEAWFGKLQ